MSKKIFSNFVFFKFVFLRNVGFVECESIPLSCWLLFIYFRLEKRLKYDLWNFPHKTIRTLWNVIEKYFQTILYVQWFISSFTGWNIWDKEIFRFNSYINVGVENFVIQPPNSFDSASHYYLSIAHFKRAQKIPNILKWCTLLDRQ